MLSTLAVENYRSCRRLVLPLRRLNLVTGANGSGKTSLYRALRLLAEVARDGAVAALAREGGLESVLWAGPEASRPDGRCGSEPLVPTVRRHARALRLGFAAGEFGYAVDFGLPAPPHPHPARFILDPEIKCEAIWSGPVLRPATLLCSRNNASVRLRADDGSWAPARPLGRFDSMLSELADAQRAPEVLTVRQQLRAWRFYDHVRTDAAAPARASQIGTFTPVLAADGADLPAALATIEEIGDRSALHTAVDHAFPGSRLDIGVSAGRFEVLLEQPGMLRPLRTPELSDGTLRYLLLLAALLSPRPPELLVLNEPETSLHPDLLSALGRLIVLAASRSQVIVVTHSAPLVAAVEAGLDDPAGTTLVLTKDFGATQLMGQARLEEPSWHRPER